jgi:hypothetical protein
MDEQRVNRVLPQALRRVDDLQPGFHACLLYETEEEYRAVVLPFVRKGLERGERVAYIADAHAEADIADYLGEDGFDVSTYAARGQLHLYTPDQTYLRHGVFDPERMIGLLRSETDRAVDEGYATLRITGEMTWALRNLPGSERLIEYEAKLNNFIPGSRSVVICQYDRLRFPPDLLLDVLATHPICIIGTSAYQNSYYVPPAELPERPAGGFFYWLGDAPERQIVEQYLEQPQRQQKQMALIFAAALELVRAGEADREQLLRLIRCLPLPEEKMPAA